MAFVGFKFGFGGSVGDRTIVRRANPSSLAAAAFAGDSIVHDDFSVTTYRPGTSAVKHLWWCWTIAPKPFIPIGFALVQVPNSSA